MPYQAVHSPSLEGPSTGDARLATVEIPEITWRQGLLRYRQDRLGLLGELGRAQRDIVKSALGPLQLVIVSSARYARAVLHEHGERFQKGPVMTRHARPVLGEGLITSAGETHQRHRKLLAPRFTPRHITRHARIIAEQTVSMLARWRIDPSGPTDFADEITKLTLIIAARCMFGSGISSAELDDLSAGLEQCNRWVIEQSTRLARLPMGVPTPRNLQARAALDRMDDVVYRMIEERRRHGHGGDVLSTLLQASDERGYLDDGNVRDQVMTFFMAGHETVASGLAWAYHALSRAPEVADRLADEVGRVLGDRTPTIDDVPGLIYTRQVLQETMRLYPPVYMIGRRATADVHVGPHLIRKGTYALVNVLGMQRRADYFAAPEEFLPERFAGSPTWPRGGYIPFGIGPRVCIGNHFAMMEGTLILATLARAIRFPAASDCVPTIEPDPLITLRPRGGIPFSPCWR